jgi:hypothetical protein
MSERTEVLVVESNINLLAASLISAYQMEYILHFTLFESSFGVREKKLK